MFRTTALTLLLTLGAAARVPAADDPELMTMKGPATATGVHFYPDGKKLLTWNWGGGDDTVIRVWDVATGKELPALSRREGLMFLRASSTGTVAAAYKTGEVQLWPADGEGRNLTTDMKNPPTALAFSPDGKRIAVGDSAGGLKILSAEGDKFEVECVGHGERILGSALAFTPDGKQLVSASTDWSLRIWNAETGKKMFTIPELGSISYLTFVGDKVYFLDTYGISYFQKCVDLTTGKVVGSNDAPTNGSGPSGLVSVLGGKAVLAVADRDNGTVVAWPTDGKETVKVEGTISAAPYRLGSWSVQNDTVFSAYKFQVVASRVTAQKDTFRVKRLRIVQEHTAAITSLAISTDGKLVATADEKGIIKVWDAMKLATPE